jgi:hypothetical protein
MMRLVLALVAITMLVSVESEAVTLTKANFDAEVFDSGKNALVKFLAPW